MFCIAAFIVLALLSIFSAGYRKQMKKAWGCVARKVTLRPCDTNFKSEIKDKLLSRVAHKSPRLIKVADVTIEVVAVLFIVLTAWSLYVAVKSGLNLYVYGTCNPSNASACSLGAEACSIETARKSFWSSISEGSVFTWIGDEFAQFGDTISAVPTRIQRWEATEYLPQNATYPLSFDSAKPVAVEVIDPGCQFCKQLYENVVEADFKQRYNLTYIAYPIKDAKKDSQYKFANSLLVVQYLEAIKLHEPKLVDGTTPADWKILQKIFTEKNDQNVDMQVVFNSLLNAQQVEDTLHNWLSDFGYSKDELTVIHDTARSKEVDEIISAHREIVENRIKTVKIPTIIFDGRRHSGVLSVDKLR